MTDNKYARAMSEITLSPNRKNLIKQAVKRNLQYKKADCNAPVIRSKSKAATFIKIATPAVAAALIAIVLTVILMPATIPTVDVTNPVSVHEYEYISNVVEYAQYLPNAELLSGSKKSATGLSGNLSNPNITNDARYDEAYQLQDGQLEFDIDDYRTFNDSLAIVSSTGVSGDLTVYDIKKEIIFAVDVIPGYDQWFTMPYNADYLSESDARLYTNNSYKLSYDKQNGVIKMVRLSQKHRGETYNPSTSVFYGNAYTRQLLEVSYYINGEGKEVVDCKVTDFLCVQERECYPLFAQRLINVRDTSATKYSVAYMLDYDLVKEFPGNNTLSAYDLSQKFDYGINVIAVQMDYSSDKDVEILKTQYTTQDAHCVQPTMTAIDYYKKTASDVTYFTSCWDNSAITYLYKIHLNDFVNVSQQSDGKYAADSEGMKKFFGYLFPLRSRLVCPVCEDKGYTDDGIFKGCFHGKHFDNIVNSKSQLLSNNEAYLSDAEVLYDDIAQKYSSLNSVLSLDARPAFDGDGNYCFENSINDFIRQSSTEYYGKYVLSAGYAAMDEEVNKNSTIIGEEYLAELMKGKYTFTYDIKDYSTVNNGNIDYVVEQKVNLKEINPQSEYYVALIVEKTDGSGEYAVIDKIQITDTDKTYKLKGSVSIPLMLDMILNVAPVFKEGDTFRLAIAVLEQNADDINVISHTKAVENDKTSEEILYKEGVVRLDGINYSYLVDKGDNNNIVVVMLENHVDYIYPVQ